MKTAEAIKNIVLEQVNGYRSLLDLLQKERGCLVNLDAAGVEDISKEKDTIVLKLRLIEEERCRLIEKFATEHDVRGEITLQRLADLTGDEALRMQRLQLISLIQSINELNAFNMVLIGRSLNFIKHSMLFLNSFASPANPMGPGTILSKEI